jgi:hypothetical protein
MGGTVWFCVLEFSAIRKRLRAGEIGVPHTCEKGLERRGRVVTDRLESRHCRQET